MVLSASPYPRPYFPESAGVVVVPEGTTSMSGASGSWSSVASLVPVSSPPRATRLPKAPVFIRAPPAFVRLDDDGSDVSASDFALTPASAHLREAILARSRTYDYDDDFPSIAASDITTSPAVDKERDRALDFDLRRSLARKASAATSGTSGRYRCRPSSPTTETAIVEPPALTREQLQLLADEPRSPRRYDFSDDFASIAESEAPPRPPDRASRRTAVAYESLRCQSEQGEFLAAPPRSSLASSIKNRMSLAASERGRLSFRGRGQKRSGIRPSVEDSILHDWKQASEVKIEESEDGDAGNPGCAAFLSKIFTTKEGGNTREEDTRWDLVDDNRFDDVQFVSILAYEEFMHSPNRPSTVTKLLSRLRRN